MSYVTIIPLHQRNMYNKINTSLFSGHSLFATDWIDNLELASFFRCSCKAGFSTKVGPLTVGSDKFSFSEFTLPFPLLPRSLRVCVINGLICRNPLSELSASTDIVLPRGECSIELGSLSLISLLMKFPISSHNLFVTGLSPTPISSSSSTYAL